MILVLSGKARAGKDTAANILKDIFEDNKETCLKIAYADFLKEILSKCFNLSHEQLYGSLKETYIEELPIYTKSGKKTNHFWNPRKLFQYVGTDVFRTIHPDCWINVVKNVISENKYDNYIVTDGRFKNEIDWIVELGGKHIHISRAGRDFSSNSSHVSEQLNIYSLEHFVHCIDNSEDIKSLRYKLINTLNL